MPTARRQPPAASVAPVAPDGAPFASLDGLRGVAAAMVVGLHAYELAGEPAGVPTPIAWLLRLGWSGVDIFFVLSAFLLALPFVRALRGAAPPDLATYARRRVLRILPAYYVQLVVLLVLVALGAAAWLPGGPPSAGAVAAHVVLWFDAWPFVQSLLPPWWTLPVEVGFYLLLPWLVRGLAPGRRRWLVLVVLASLGWRVAMAHAGLPRAEEVLWANQLPGRLHEFVVGLFAADWFVARQAQGRLPSARRAAAWAALAGAVFVALPALGWVAGPTPYGGTPSPHPLLVGWHLYAGIVVAVLVVALASGAGPLGRAFAAPPLRVLGRISYGLYLWHYPVLLALRDALGGRDAAAREFGGFLLVGALLSLLAAGLSWTLVERAALRLAHKAPEPPAPARPPRRSARGDVR
jgi:peptidoglycan/LPS O-acetylase OafA/YrhL